MQTYLGHIQLTVRSANLPFYRGLMEFLGWHVLYGDESTLGVAASEDGGASLWFIGGARDVANDYDGPGMNHLALHTTTQGDVDAAATYLMQLGVQMLFDTPRHRPEYADTPDKTYYQIMFESPDRLLLEVVYTGLKAD